jgi:hypothetical protein
MSILNSAPSARADISPVRSGDVSEWETRSLLLCFPCSPLGRLNSLVIKLRELILGYKIGEDVRITAGDSHEAMNFLTEFVTK